MDYLCRNPGNLVVGFVAGANPRSAASGAGLEGGKEKRRRREVKSNAELAPEALIKSCTGG